MIQKFIHGSEDSVDVDVFFVVDRLSPIKQENKVLCDSLSQTHGVNGNIITIGGTEGSRVVTGVYKGTIDEVNNSLFTTYPLHIQEHPCPVDHLVRRDVHLKMLRVLRGVLSQCSRTEHRTLIKTALHSNNILTKLDTLNKISLHKIENFGEKKAPVIEVRKFFAFQIIQALGLMEDVEVYTKKDAAEFFPMARPALYRDPNLDPIVISQLSIEFLRAWYELFQRVDAHFHKDCTKVDTPFGTLDFQTETYI